MQSYIIGGDSVGRALMDALAERAAAGVEVRVLYDEFGSAQAIMRGFFRRYANRPHLQVVRYTQANLYKHQFQINLHYRERHPAGYHIHCHCRRAPPSLADYAVFCPPPEIQRALRCAALRGVEVKLLLPACNNHPYVGYAGRALYDGLLEVGVRIFEQPPPFLHAKAMLVDDAMALIGSANLDTRSLRLNYENSLIVLDAAFGARLKRVMLDDFALGHEIHLAHWRTRSLRQRLTENFCSLLSPLA